MPSGSAAGGAVTRQTQTAAVETLHTWSGCLVRLTIGEQQFVTVSGTVTRAEPVRAQWLLASRQPPEAVQWEQLLSRSDHYQWMQGGKRYMLPQPAPFRRLAGRVMLLQSGRNVVHYMGIITIHPKGGRGFGD